MTKIFSLFFDPNYVKTTSNHQTTRFGGFSEEFLKKFVRPNLAIHGFQKNSPEPSDSLFLLRAVLGYIWGADFRFAILRASKF